MKRSKQCVHFYLIPAIRTTSAVRADYDGDDFFVARGIWSANGVWYTSQKEDWLGWLSQSDGPGAYDRKTWRGRSAKFVYNQIQCPPMLLWLAEAVGASKAKLQLARRSAHSGPHNKASYCAMLQEIIPWQDIEGRL